MKVLVVQPQDWKRIQDNLSRYNREAEEAKLKREERDRLHETSKNMVKNWDNTNEVYMASFYVNSISCTSILIFNCTGHTLYL